MPKKDTKVKLENLSSKSPVVSPVFNSILSNKKEHVVLPKTDSRDSPLSTKTTPVVSKDNAKEAEGVVAAKGPEKDHSKSLSVSNHGEFHFQSQFIHTIAT